MRIEITLETDTDERIRFRIGRREGRRMINEWSPALTVDEARQLRTELDAALRNHTRGDSLRPLNAKDAR